MIAPDRRKFQSLLLATMKNWGVWLKWVTLDEFHASRPQAAPDQVGPPIDDVRRELVVQEIISATEYN